MEQGRASLTSFTSSGKPKRSIASLQVERRYRNVITLFLSGQLPNFDHERHVQVANILRHLPFGRELMHLGLQTMAYRHFVRRLTGNRPPGRSPDERSLSVLHAHVVREDPRIAVLGLLDRETGVLHHRLEQPTERAVFLA